MARRRGPWVRNRTVALWGGVAAYVLGSVLLYDAWENRGGQRPFWARLLPS